MADKSGSREATRSSPVGKDEKVRVAFDFSAESLKRLDELQAATHAATRAEVIRNALRLYMRVFEEVHEKGSLLQFERKDGRVVQLEFFLS